MRSLLSTLLLTAMTGVAAQQDSALIAGAFDDFTTDELGNVYALSGDVLTLYDPTGKPLARNSVKTFGRISSIDAFYSLKPLVFSADQKQLVMLDNTLSPRGGAIDLAQRGYPQVTLVCAGVQNCTWLFDQREGSITRLDAQLRQLASSGRIDQLLGYTPRPVQLQEHNSRLYVNDPGHGLLVFDLFASYMKTIPITGATHIQVRGEVIYFLDEKGRPAAYDSRSFAITELPVGPADRILDVRFEQGRSYALRPDGILIRPVAAP